jgi:hypothetical protein
MILGAVLLALAACAGAAFAVNQAFSKTDTTKRTITEPVRAVVIDADAGDVRLVRGTGAIHVTATREYVFAKPHVTHVVEDGVLRLKSACGRAFVFDCDTHFRVEIPAGVSVNVETSAGDVDGVALDSGDVRIETKSGDIDLGFVDQPDRVDALTTAGDVALGVPGGTYAIDVHTDLGDSDVDGLVVDERARRSITIRTQVGDVRVGAR